MRQHQPSTSTPIMNITPSHRPTDIPTSHHTKERRPRRSENRQRTRISFPFLSLSLIFLICRDLKHDTPIPSYLFPFGAYAYTVNFNMPASIKRSSRSSFFPSKGITNSHAKVCSFQKNSRRNEKATTLAMVLTTPEFVIERASTLKLLDDLIDESTRMSARKPFIMQFRATPLWIWRQWKGTVFAESWKSSIFNMMFATVVVLTMRMFPNGTVNLSGFSTLWGQLLSLTTFTLTFFLNKSYDLWRKCMELSRRLQGRLQDLSMSLAAHASRTAPTSPGTHSTYTPEARQILLVVSRYIRVFNLLTYASFTRSHRPILTPAGMRRLVERKLLTPDEHKILISNDVPATQRHNAILSWIMRLMIEGRKSGHFIGKSGFEQQFLEKSHVIRAQYGAIGDELQGRMPLAYAHIVQILVDAILWLYPVMACTSGFTPWLAVVGTGLLTLCYQGLFDLAKQFLDPYDNETFGYGDDPLCVDTLVAETNAGSVRWMNGFEQMPFSSTDISNGKMDDYVLPLRGLSVAELEEIELEKQKNTVENQVENEVNTTTALSAQDDSGSDENSLVPDTDVEEHSNHTISLSENQNGDVTNTVSITIEEEQEVIEENNKDRDITTHTVTSLETGMPVTIYDTDKDILLKESVDGAMDDLDLPKNVTSNHENILNTTTASPPMEQQHIDDDIDHSQIDTPEIQTTLLETSDSYNNHDDSNDQLQENSSKTNFTELGTTKTTYSQKFENSTKELLETEAILNADPGASSLDTEEEQDDIDEDYDINQMVSYQEDYSVPTKEMLEAKEKERIETEAILNAGPGASTVDILEESDEEEEREEVWNDMDDDDDDECGEECFNILEMDGDILSDGYNSSGPELSVMTETETNGDGGEGTITVGMTTGLDDNEGKQIDIVTAAPDKDESQN